ncbi:MULTISPECIES: oxygen-dependent tRNA uridine(34) hydroxylase TrhO [Parachlamydia]|jgi:UPF0176 protein|uniref:oxygen-dependent tRNA uridine(34) hydroxylase TrhO n=1 Tax=Parachlamydia TaxID=83551 RepID=UPI000750A23E|nr:rhodanese-related sulfurtransferase [Parachlamydia acanthamoebae]
MPYYVLAYYHFTPLENPREEVISHQKFFKDRDVSSRIYISEQGINGQMSASDQDAEAYMNWLHAKPDFATVEFKLHTHHEHVFPRKSVKYRKNLVAYDKAVNLNLRGEHVSPKKWREMLEDQEHKILIDVRNDYEWKVGHFENAELPPCETFRDFDGYSDNLKEQVDPKKTPVMMYCTGGIRCELYSSILKEKGFEKVYQLHGGVINYGLQEGSSHWKGKLFVFDDRMTVPISEEESEVIAKCHHCGVSAESYYNCANMDCNHLFICCSDCLLELAGCCKEACKDAPRVRPYHDQNPHKPFRKWHNYFTEKKKEA